MADNFPVKIAYNNMKRVANRFGGLQPFCRFHSKKSVLYNTSVDFFHSQWYCYGKSKHIFSQIRVSMYI